MRDRHELLGIVTAGICLIGGGIVISHLAPQSEVAVPSVAITAALSDYHPRDFIQTPDEYDASAANCWDRYLEVKAQLGQLRHRVDSLQAEYYKARGRIADLEQER